MNLQLLLREVVLRMSRRSARRRGSWDPSLTLAGSDMILSPGPLVLHGHLEQRAMGILMIVAFVGASLAALVQPILMGLIWHRLRIRFPDRWIDLGRPAIIRNQGLEAMLRTRRLSRRGFRELGDPVLRRMAIGLVWIERAGYISLIMFGLAIVGVYT